MEMCLRDSKNSKKRWNLHLIVIFSNSKDSIASGVANDTSSTSTSSSSSAALISILIRSSKSAICDEYLTDSHSFTLSAVYLLSCSELYLFFFCLIRESIASHSIAMVIAVERSPQHMPYLKRKHEFTSSEYRKRYIVWKRVREGIATHLSNDTKRSISIICLHLLFSRCVFSAIQFGLVVRQLTIDDV